MGSQNKEHARSNDEKKSTQAVKHFYVEFPSLSEMLAHQRNALFLQSILVGKFKRVKRRKAAQNIVTCLSSWKKRAYFLVCTMNYIKKVKRIQRFWRWARRHWSEVRAEIEAEWAQLERNISAMNAQALPAVKENYRIGTMSSDMHHQNNSRQMHDLHHHHHSKHSMNDMYHPHSSRQSMTDTHHSHNSRLPVNDMHHQHHSRLTVHGMHHQNNRLSASGQSMNLGDKQLVASQAKPPHAETEHLSPGRGAHDSRHLQRHDSRNADRNYRRLSVSVNKRRIFLTQELRDRRRRYLERYAIWQLENYTYRRDVQEWREHRKACKASGIRPTMDVPSMPAPSCLPSEEEIYEMVQRAIGNKPPEVVKVLKRQASQFSESWYNCDDSDVSNRLSAEVASVLAPSSIHPDLSCSVLEHAVV